MNGPAPDMCYDAVVQAINDWVLTQPSLDRNEKVGVLDRIGDACDDWGWTLLYGHDWEDEG